ncbi:MAG: DUF11 domain-containing protein [Geobacteraceae bacterium]|nr:DUF11 domain-containing protein [Geobacteraceae bacterium]
MNRSTFLAALLLSTALLLPSLTQASPQIAVSITATKQIVETKNGAKSIRLVPAATTASGEELTYTLDYSNKGTETAVDATIDNPIPKGTSYISNTARGDKSEITFSADGGKNYGPPTRVSHEVRLPSGKLEKRVATPEEFTHIRWTIKQIPAGSGGSVGFKVRVR